MIPINGARHTNACRQRLDDAISKTTAGKQRVERSRDRLVSHWARQAEADDRKSDDSAGFQEWMQAGVRAQLVGLILQPHLNGTPCRLIARKGNRWHVNAGEGETFNVLPVNLKAAPEEEGSGTEPSQTMPPTREEPPSDAQGTK